MVGDVIYKPGMLRSLLLLCVMCALAHADPVRTLPVDVVTKGKTGDWTLLEGKRRDGTTMVDDRALISILGRTPTQLRVGWFEGAKDAEHWAFGFDVDATQPLDTVMVAHPADVIDVTTAPAKCRLDVELACSKVTIKTKSETITLMMAPRVRGTGIVSLVSTDAKGVVLSLQVTGYGHGAKAEWGKPASKAKLVEPTPPAMGEGPPGEGGFAPPPPKTTEPGLDLEELEVAGKLDQAIVRRYIKRNFQKLRYCYEKELVAKPKLGAGKVKAAFEIAGDGKVSSMTANGVDVQVSDCIAHVLRYAEYPKPADGKPVKVRVLLGLAPAKGQP